MAIPIDPCKEALADFVFKSLQELTAITPAAEFSLTPKDIFALIEKPPEPQMGDYSLPCFRFAKPLKMQPQAIANALAAKITANPSGQKSRWIEKTTVLNAFLNFHIRKDTLAATTLRPVLDGTLFDNPLAPKGSEGRVMVEYSQPNTHKEFHVGHMRNVCLGSALVKLNRYCGFEVIAVNYLGDEGAHIAKCLWQLQRSGKSPHPTEEKGAWLGKIYAEAVQSLAAADPKTLEVYEREVSEVLQGIESKKGPWFDLWLKTRQWSLDAFKSVYEWIGAEFDRDFFESELSSESQSIVDEFLKKGVFKEDQGAVGIDLADFKLGFMLVRKRDGNTLYATKDLVLARRKFDEFKIGRNIYVVGNEQNHHFRQVFKTLDLMGFRQASQCFHLSYGMVVLPEGKMSSRAGTSVPFMTLKDTMLAEIELILAKYQGEWPESELKETARRLCVGAIKYGMLQADPAREIIFDIKDWLSFEGNTGPYLMYGYSRANSVLSKAKEKGFTPLPLEEISPAAFQTMGPAEAELLRSIYDFNGIVLESCLQNRPSHLATHLYYLCKNFSRFYAEVPVLKSSEPELIPMRLTLIEGFRKTLREGLGLLGMTPPERM